MTATASPLPTNSIAVSDLRDEHSDVIGRVSYGKERFVLTKYGRPVAALIPLDDLELLEALEDRVDIEAIAEARNDPDNRGEPVSLDDVKAELGL
jgi:prevent-host-death family protein